MGARIAPMTELRQKGERRRRPPASPKAKTSSPGQRRPRRLDRDHLAFIHRLPSVIDGTVPVEAAHIRSVCLRHEKVEPGMQQKPDDRWTIPLARERHAEQHSMNEMEFWRSHNIDPFEVALHLYQFSQHGDMEGAILFIQLVNAGRLCQWRDDV